MGISSGLTDLDAKIGGFLPGQLIVVAGRPAMGKTTFAMSLLDPCGAQGAEVSTGA